MYRAGIRAGRYMGRSIRALRRIAGQYTENPLEGKGGFQALEGFCTVFPDSGTGFVS